MASKKQSARPALRGINASSGSQSAQPKPLADEALVTMEAEVPEGLHQGLQTFLEGRPGWDASSLLTSALASFLFQNGWSDPCVAQLYLETLDSGTQDGVNVAA
jgi:hypothetical protein